uniref:uncharacterized protein LOC109966415 n=1 Tax=Monopterus albus TaxID=43700 RepID=UPI0009B351AE|nr:uncharacterized protein LOC109966415 [Monopterus albus]
MRRWLKGEDIWKKVEDKEWGGKRKIKPNSKWKDNKEDENQRQSKQQKTKKATCPAKETADQMIEDLKKDLMAKQKVLKSTTEYEESSDEDLLPRNWSKARLQIKELIAENKRLKEGNVKKIVEAMKELPAVMQKLKDITEQFSWTSSSASAGSTPVRSELPGSTPASPELESVDMVSLVPGSDVKVPRQKLNSLQTSNSSVYIGDLAVLVYSRETLSCSSLTGRQSGAHKDVESKPQLDGTKLDAILGHALSKFPGISVQDVRRIIQKKCNNENYKQAATKKTLDI